jgi:diguanylate cyclase (GGDEF)-like protein
MVSLNCFPAVSLRTKIIGILFLILSITMSVGLYGLWSYQRGKLLDMRRQKALQTGRTIEAGLRYAMLQNDKKAIQASLEDMVQAESLISISLLNKEGMIASSSDIAMVGRVLNKDTDETCLLCHQGQGSPTKEAAVVANSSNSPLLRTIIPIENNPVCHGCHPQNQKLCGVLVLDDSLSEINELLKTVIERIVLTTILSFLVIIAVISFIITKFVSSPVKSILSGIKRIENGDFKTWVNVGGKGEFSEMADSFNVMTQALGRYVTELKDKTDEIQTLYTIVKRMSETIDWKEIKVVLVDLLFDILEAESVILFFPLDNEELHFEVTWKTKNDKRYYHRRFSPDSGGPPVGFVSNEELKSWIHEGYIRPLFLDGDRRALVPMNLKEMQLGLICAVKTNNQQFSTQEKRLLPDLMQHIAVSFANARLYNLATTDDLTALYTKRYFETKIKELEERFGRTGENYCLMMLDMDHFKDVNDSYGHPVGDLALKQIGELLRENVRHADIPCRYGGEEFVVLLPKESLRCTSILAERLRRKVAEHLFQAEGVPPFHKTVSIGIACCPEHAVAADQLVEVADAAMYAAKKNGRNQVWFAGGEKEKNKGALNTRRR